MGTVYTGIGSIDYPEDVLNGSEILEFGSTVYGVIERIGKPFATGCFMKSDKAILLWGPVPVAVAREHRLAQKQLENMLMTDFSLGYRSQIESVLVDVEVGFRAYAEGLIIDNDLIRFHQDLYRGRILLLGQVWNLLVQDSIKVLKSNLDSVSVDYDLHLLH